MGEKSKDINYFYLLHSISSQPWDIFLLCARINQGKGAGSVKQYVCNCVFVLVHAF